jgi:hypothetical protein
MSWIAILRKRNRCKEIFEHIRCLQGKDEEQGIISWCQKTRPYLVFLPKRMWRQQPDSNLWSLLGITNACLGTNSNPWAKSTDVRLKGLTLPTTTFLPIYFQGCWCGPPTATIDSDYSCPPPAGSAAYKVLCWSPTAVIYLGYISLHKQRISLSHYHNGHGPIFIWCWCPWFESDFLWKYKWILIEIPCWSYPYCFSGDQSRKRPGDDGTDSTGKSTV